MQKLKIAGHPFGMPHDVLLECPRTSFRDVLGVNVTESVWHCAPQMAEVIIFFHFSWGPFPTDFARRISPSYILCVHSSRVDVNITSLFIPVSCLQLWPTFFELQQIVRGC